MWIDTCVKSFFDSCQCYWVMKLIIPKTSFSHDLHRSQHSWDTLNPQAAAAAAADKHLLRCEKFLYVYIYVLYIDTFCLCWPWKCHKYIKQKRTVHMSVPPSFTPPAKKCIIKSVNNLLLLLLDFLLPLNCERMRHCGLFGTRN